MKRILRTLSLSGILLWVLVSLSSCETFVQDNVEAADPQTRVADAGERPYYWYRGEKTYLTLDLTTVNVVMAEGAENSLEPIRRTGRFEVMQKFRDDNLVKLKLKAAPSTTAEYAEAVGALKQTGKVKHVLPYYETGAGSEPIGTSDVFYVKLRSGDDLPLLERAMRQRGVRIVKHSEWMPLWYVLSMADSDFANAVEASNWFYETGDFDAVDPAFMFDFQPASSSATPVASFTPTLIPNYSPIINPNDPEFSQQWGLKNTDYPDHDINVVDAWKHAYGENVVVAVVDDAINPNHQDLAANMHSLSYDTKSGVSPIVYVSGSNGMRVAGVIAAVGDNDVGIIGVAPESKIMSISHDQQYSDEHTIAFDIGLGILWAMDHGAHIICNTWRFYWYNGGVAVYSDVLNQAIECALEDGRGGLGCVIVFAVGGNHGPFNNIPYPANSHPDILTVASFDATGNRYYSDYGIGLDVIAPGHDIVSTSTNNTITSSSHTSLAAAHVAGVAALVLSQYPDLYQYEVVDLIETKAVKVGPETYGDQSTRPNGLWNEKYGYGVVDAHATVSSVKGGEIAPQSQYYWGNLISNPVPPALLTNVALASYESSIGAIELNSVPGAQYSWQSRHDGTQWADIPGAYGPAYQPPEYNVTTYYRRRAQYMSNYAYSNTVVVYAITTI